MSKPTLELIHCSNPSGAKHRARGGRRFRPLVIQGGARTRSVSSWEAALELIHLGLAVSNESYLCFLQALLDTHTQTDPEKTG